MAFNLSLSGGDPVNGATEETLPPFVRYPKNAPGPFYEMYV